MSLIHEALKRVEADKGQPPRLVLSCPPGVPGASPGRPAAPPMPAIAALAEPAARPRKRLWFRRSPTTMVLGIAVLIMISLLGVFFVIHRGLPVPSTAAAKGPEAPKGQMSIQATPAEVGAAAPASPPAATQAPTPTPPAAAAAEGAPARAAAAAPKAPAAAATEAIEEERPAGPARPGHPPAAAAKLKVTGIMCGPTGGAALINGRLVHVGQEIEGAKLVGTSTNTVELEMEGVRFSLGIQP